MIKRDKENFNLQLVVLIAGVLLMSIKFIAFFLTHSNTILTDASESIVNVVAGLFTLFSLWYAAKPRDTDHPYGHGKIEFISAGVEGALIFMAGISMLIKSVYDLFYLQEIHHIDWGIYLVLITAAINFFLGFLLNKRGKLTKSPALVAGGKHLQSDAYSTLAMIIGLMLIYFTEEPRLDSIVAIIMACFIMIMAMRILRRSLAGIMDETDTEVVQEILAILNKNRKPEWIDVHNLRVIKYGSTYHIDCHVTLPWYYDIKTAHDEIEKIAKTIEENSKNDVEFFIHTDPCLPFSCTVCTLENCKVRNHSLQNKLEWTIPTLLSNNKHGKPKENL